MSEAIDLSREIERQLPPEMVEFLCLAGSHASKERYNLYLVGGIVRDLLLGRVNLDLDLVVEGDAIALGRQLAGITGGRLVTHTRFNTAKLRWDRWSVDIATARSETYDRPGALPRVKPGSLKDDLFRRDFTINAMAIQIAPGSYGRLIDLYGGRQDLEYRLIRTLHENSFIDDATRIWRAMRYEQRLDFHLEARTLGLLKRNIPMLDTISGDRIRHELELALKEEFPERVLLRANELGVLSRLHPGLRGDAWLAGKFEQARQLNVTGLALLQVYIAQLAYRLTENEVERLISYLKLAKPIATVLRDTQSLKSRLPELANGKLQASNVYHILRPYSITAIAANLVTCESDIARKNIQLYLDKLRYVKSSLSGKDLEKMGIVPGPGMKEVLARLLEARLNGKVTSKQEEEKLAAELLRGRT